MFYLCDSEKSSHEALRGESSAGVVKSLLDRAVSRGRVFTDPSSDSHGDHSSVTDDDQPTRYAARVIHRAEREVRRREKYGDAYDRMAETYER